MKRKGSLAIVLICVLVGILIILQMKTVDQLGGTVDSERAGDLATEVKALDNKNAELNDQLNDLEKQLADYESSAAGADEVVKKKQEALEKERIMAGVVDVTGEGLMITIDADTSKE
ncbi:MAG: hypothetical protein RR564_07445, partial [Eubacterium sp.]